ncbi:MaoC/PaaZ C-terminal domain-containing protein [Streptomyces sp. NPDC048430]|uniref:MaoC/PaaZ C-terminal domain-containing protein n=1 Tax=Streptomyces sp. NPDC048430 TaxID=3155388 RepID=UPI00342D9297
MSLNHGIIGVPGEPVERSWTTTDVLLYALGVGAGHPDPTDELEFTTENSLGVPTRVLPTFGNMLGVGGGPRQSLGDFDPAAFVHAEQAFTLHRPIPVEGTARSISTVVGMYDKGSAALVVTESTSVDAATDEPVVTTRTSIFIRGEGGFGGDRGPSADWSMPTRAADHQVTYRTSPEQALLYRLTGDRNPLHSDPKFAARAGFERPILHGMCTYGYTGRALLHAVCGSDPARFTAMEGRFTRPVLPGDALTVSIWVDGGTAYFRTTANDATVIDRGRLTFTS